LPETRAPARASKPITMPGEPSCPHFDGTTKAPRGQACESCGSTFNLRVCTTCGHVGCCESQQGHNTKHAKESGHAVIKSMPVGDGHFTWCYECKRYLR
jgi:CPA1 family monovalent cation:H+ antiporter